MIDILIFTNERPKYLKRSIQYWSNSNFNIIIADASKNSYQGNIPKNFKYFHLPGTTSLYRIIYLAKKTKFKYAAYCADDDFISFEGIKKMHNFLEKNEEYACAQGLYLKVGQKNNAQTLLFGTAYLSNISVDTKKINGDKNDLLNEILNFKFPICYALMRSSVLENYIKIFNGLDLENYSKGRPPDQLFEDLMFYALFVSGHYITLPVFYSLRQNQIAHYRKSFEYKDKLYLDDLFADWVKKDQKEWQIVKKNINSLIKDKFRFNFNFDENVVLAKYLKIDKQKSKPELKKISYIRYKLNHFKINLFILLKIKFNLKDYISYYNFLKLIKKIISTHDVEN